MTDFTSIFTRHLAAFRRTTPFGVLLEHDMQGVIKATTRDSGTTVTEVLKEISNAP